jgi:carbon storage regulator CsrA
MLVLTRKLQEQIKIGDNIVVTILQVRGQAVRVGIDAPRTVRVLRAELANTEPPASPTDRPSRGFEPIGEDAIKKLVAPARPLSSRLQARRAPSARLTSSISTSRRLGAATMATLSAAG